MAKVVNQKKTADRLPKNPTATAPWATNLTQTPIAITEDKLRLILLQSKTALQSRKDWLTPFGLMLSCIIVLTTTSEFKSPLGINMQTLFGVFLVLSSIWLLYDLYLMYRNWYNGSIDCIIHKIMNKPVKSKGKKQKRITNKKL